MWLYNGFRLLDSAAVRQHRQLALTTEGDLLVAHFLVRPTQLGLLVKARMKT